MTTTRRAATPPSRRGLPAIADRSLLVAGMLILAATVAVIAVAAVRYLGSATGPLLPLSWCGGEDGGSPLPPLTGSRWFTSWQMDWIGVGVLAGFGALYLAGVAAVARRGRHWPLWRTLSFVAGLGVAALAVTSAIAVYDMALFSSHMLGHLALVMVAPPLLVLGHPMTLALHATRNPWHNRIKRVLRSRPVALWFSPPVALAAYTVVIVGTHLTGLMDVIMTHPWAGEIEHATYLLVGFQFFVLAIGDEPLRWRLSMPGRQFLLALAMAVDTLAGVVLLQTSRAMQTSTQAPNGTDPLAETHLGGALMWVGGDGIMALAMVVVALMWVRRPSNRRRANAGWLEEARRSTLIGRTDGVDATAHVTARDIDDDEQALAGYNAWLADLEREHPTP